MEECAIADRLLRRPEVEQIVGAGTSTLYKMIREGNFPKPVKITTAAVRWRLSEINAWIEARSVAATNQPSAA